MSERGFVERNSAMVKEFDRYILEHPEFAEQLPDNALVVMQIEGDEEFNQWARQAAREAAETDTPVAYATITEIKPVRSRIEGLRVELAA